MHLKQNHIEIGSSLGTVFGLILVILWLSANNAPASGYVAALMAFVVAMGAAGIWIAKMYGK